jgi:hypothetical protein
MRALLEPMLRELAPRFATMYADGGRPSIPPEQLLRALVSELPKLDVVGHMGYNGA